MFEWGSISGQEQGFSKAYFRQVWANEGFWHSAFKFWSNSWRSIDVFQGGKIAIKSTPINTGSNLTTKKERGNWECGSNTDLLQDFDSHRKFLKDLNQLDSENGRETEWGERERRQEERRQGERKKEREREKHELIAEMTTRSIANHRYTWQWALSEYQWTQAYK